MKVSEFFEQDHQRLDSVIKGFRQSLQEGAPNRGYFDQLLHGLHRHIFWEEDLLFPLVKTPDTTDIIEEFCTDHGLIWKNLAELGAGLDQGMALGQLELTLDGMTEMLEAHNIDEERTIYAQADRVRDNHAATEFLDRVKGADTPGDWHPAEYWA